MSNPHGIQRNFPQGNLGPGFGISPNFLAPVIKLAQTSRKRHGNDRMGIQRIIPAIRKTCSTLVPLDSLKQKPSTNKITPGWGVRKINKR